MTKQAGAGGYSALSLQPIGSVFDPPDDANFLEIGFSTGAKFQPTWLFRTVHVYRHAAGFFTIPAHTDLNHFSAERGQSRYRPRFGVLRRFQHPQELMVMLKFGCLRRIVGTRLFCA